MNNISILTRALSEGIQLFSKSEIFTLLESTTKLELPIEARENFWIMYGQDLKFTGELSKLIPTYAIYANGYIQAKREIHDN